MTSPIIALVRDWSDEPAVVVSLAVAVVWYAVGLHALWTHAARGRGIPLRDAAAFAAGMLVLALALLSPLHDVSEELFTAHMIQHELLMVVAAPLLIVGRPVVAMVWAMPPRVRGWVGRVTRGRAWRAVWHSIIRPFDAWLLHGVAIWVWHLPWLFQATLTSDAMHAAQHLSFMLTALCFWWAMLHPRRRASLGMSIVYLFTTAVHTAVLGALITFAKTPWYPDYASGAARWGWSALQDQQMAGLVMWIPASVAYLVAAVLIMRRWLAASEASTWGIARDERVAVVT